jgi:hypothetical protein
MKSNFGNRDFEEFVRQNADQYRMFPSEEAWKNIHNSLHTRKKWYGAGLAFLLLLTAGAVTWVMTANPVSETKQQTAITHNTATNQNIASPAVPTIPKNNVVNKPGQIPGFIMKSDAISSNDITNLPQKFPILNDIQTNSEELTIAGIAPVLKIHNTEQPFNNLTTKITDALPEDIIVRDEVISIAPAKTIEVSEHEEILTSSPETGYPLTIESVTNTYRSGYNGKKILWQFFITPTISYRQLSANDNSTFSNALGIAPNGSRSVNSAVTHRPDLGLQIGVNAGYPLTKSLKLRGGLQFNVNRYDIKASAYNPELATISLNDGTGSSISAWTNYRTYGGYRTNWLKNFYFSVSAPIGVELQLAKGKKMNWGIAGTLQPTYILKDKAYLISTDYKNYAKVPWLVRRVNFSTGVETFIGFGEKTKWQIGPQVRYQVLSSFNNEYPVKEHLFDFGLKVGVFLNQ